MLDRRMGSASELLTDISQLIGYWKGCYVRDEERANSELRYYFRPDGRCKYWIAEPGHETFDQIGWGKWGIAEPGIAFIADEHAGIWYPDLWRVLIYSPDMFLLANEDASIKQQFVRSTEKECVIVKESSIVSQVNTSTKKAKRKKKS